MAWILKHKTEFRSTFRNDLHTTTIYWDVDNFPAVQEKDAPQSQPLMLKVTAQDETLEATIRGSELVMKMYSDENYEFIDYFTANDRFYKVIHRINNVKKWTGWLTPDLYSEPHEPTEYMVSLSAIEGFGTLRNRKWLDSDGNLFTGKKNYLHAILDILALLGTDLNVYESCYVYEANMDTEVSDSPLVQLYFDSERFVNDGKAMNCYEVLESLLGRFHLTLRHQGDHYHIIQVNAQKDSGYYRREYQLDHTKISYGLYNPHVNITDSDEPNATFLGYVDEWALTTFTPAWKNFILSEDFGLTTNLIGNGLAFRYAGTCPNYGDVYPPADNVYLNAMLSPSGWTDPNGRKTRGSILMLPEFDSDTKLISATVGDIATSTTQYIHFKTKIFLHGLYGKIEILIVNTDGSYYLQSDGKWSDTRKFLFSQTSTNQLSGDEIEVDSDYIPISGSLVIRFTSYDPGDPARPDYPDRFFIDLKATEFEIMDNQNVMPESLELETIINENNNFEGALETKLGDLPDVDNNTLIYTGGLYYYDSGYHPTSSWHRMRLGVGDMSGTLNEIISDEICSNHLLPAIKREGTLMGSLHCLNIINEQSVKFMIISDEVDYGEDLHGVVLLQIGGSFKTGEYISYKQGGWLYLKNGKKIALKSRNR